MFYLSYYFQVMKKYYGVALGYHLAATLVLLHVLQVINFNLWWRPAVSENSLMQNDYFHALILEAVDVNNVIRKMGELPGVSKIKLTGKEELKNIAANLSEGLGINGQLTEISASAIQVFFHEGLSIKAKELIRNYLSKLAGASNVNIGPITNLYPDRPLNEGKSSHPWMSWVQNQIGFWPLLVFLVLLQLFWFKKLSQVLAIVNKYQRRQYMLGRVWGIGHGLLLICCFPLLIWRGITLSDCYWFWGFFGALIFVPFLYQGPVKWLEN